MKLRRREFLITTITSLAGTPMRADNAQPRFVMQWGKRGKAEGEFDSPIGLAINERDEIYVTEFKNNRVQKFTTEGKLLAVIPVGNMPGGIAVDKRGRIYVAHLLDHNVTVHDDSGKTLFEFGRQGIRDGELDQPGGMIFGREGTLYVADQVNRQVQQFTPEGRFIRRWGEYGIGPGQFGGNEHKPNRTGGPQFVAVDRHGFVYTTEGSVCRVQKFTPDGRFILAWGENSALPGGFGGRPLNLPGPIGIAVDHQDRVWVSATNNRVQCFTNTGRFLCGFGGDGSGPSQFKVPHGLAFDSRNNLYVVDAGNARIQKFAVGQ